MAGSSFLWLDDHSNAWGFYGHRKINRMAVFTLPAEMMPVYKTNIEFITAHAVDPDKRRYAVEGEDKNHYKLSEDSKEKLRWFLEGKKHLSWTSTYWMTFIGIWENQDLYIRVVNRTGENFMFHIDKNMTVEILDVAKSPPHVWLPLLDPHFSVNSILLSFEDQVDVVSRRREKEGPKK